VQTLHWELNGDQAQVEKRLREEIRALARHRVADAVLIDTKTAVASGGTGTAFDWERAHEVLADAAGKLRLIVAGGLTPENVAEAIRTLRPWGVDVSSGVELAPGKKDPARVREFIRAARAAFAEIENSVPRHDVS
jgi:phosphoribosylanthranilate isomerase